MLIIELDYNETTFSSLSQVEKFINKYGLDYTLNQRDEYGHTPTHWLALNGHAHVFRSLVQKGGKIDLHSNNGQGPRPIHWASRNGHVAVVDILLGNGAGVPVDATDHKGLTPLMMACMFGRSMAAAYLLGKGAAPHLTGEPINERFSSHLTFKIVNLQT